MGVTKKPRSDCYEDEIVMDNIIEKYLIIIIN